MPWYDVVGQATVILTVAAALYAAGRRRWSRSRVDPPDPGPTDVFGLKPKEPRGQCGHQAAPVPVEVDFDGNGQPEVVNWLCSECGALASPPASALASTGPSAPSSASDLREALAKKDSELKALLVSASNPGSATRKQHDEYIRAVEEAQAIRYRLRAMETLEEGRSALRKIGQGGPYRTETEEILSHQGEVIRVLRER